MGQLKIEFIDPRILKPAEYNPRQMTEEQAKNLRESIRRFGLVDPILANRHPGRENIVIGGHQRLQIALDEGIDPVPVVYIDLDPKAEQELNLRLNKNQGEWNWDMLANINRGTLEGVGFEGDLLDLKFQTKEVSFRRIVFNCPPDKYDLIQEKMTAIMKEHQIVQSDLLPFLLERYKNDPTESHK